MSKAISKAQQQRMSEGIPRSAKIHPLDVQDWSNGYGPYLMSKGWHEAHRFKDQAKQRGLEIDDCGEPELVWLRCVPDSKGEYAYQFYLAEPWSAGSFAATLAIEKGTKAQ